MSVVAESAHWYPRKKVVHVVSIVCTAHTNFSKVCTLSGLNRALVVLDRVERADLDAEAEEAADDAVAVPPRLPDLLDDPLLGIVECAVADASGEDDADSDFRACTTQSMTRRRWNVVNGLDGKDWRLMPDKLFFCKFMSPGSSSQEGVRNEYSDTGVRPSLSKEMKKWRTRKSPSCAPKSIALENRNV